MEVGRRWSEAKSRSRRKWCIENIIVHRLGAVESDKWNDIEMLLGWVGIECVYLLHLRLVDKSSTGDKVSRDFMCCL